MTRYSFTTTWVLDAPLEPIWDAIYETCEWPEWWTGVRRADELAGVGRWRFFRGDGATAVTYEWEVETTAHWMNLFAPLARPLFAWNHDHVMRGGGEGLARLLGARLLVCAS